MDILQLRDEQYDAWDRFVYRHQDATFFHLSGWKKAVQAVFGHTPFYLYALDNGEIQGILPLFLIRSRLFGKFLVSTPYAVYGGVCARDDEIRRKLFEKAKEIAGEQDVDYLELRNLRPDALDLPRSDLYVTFMKDLPEQTGECLPWLPRKARAAVRQGIKHGLEHEVSINRLEELYQLNSIQMRRLGSPGLPLFWFRRLIDEFQDQVTILSVIYQGRVVASVFVFLFRDVISPYYSGALPEFYRYQTNNFMYLKLMEYGVEKGYRVFDFGRSRKDTGPYSFKKNQGFTPQPLCYQYYLHRRDQIPNVNPSNPKFDLPKGIWKRMPLSLTQWLGPKLIRGLP
jgi:FemAB-related protein (PEP-CTERM system-associated)